MEWWPIAIIVYCALTYILGIFISLFYLLVIDLAKYTDKITVNCDLGSYWPAALLFTVLSPIFVPWWIIEFIKVNRRQN